MSDLVKKFCKPCEGGTSPMSEKEISGHLQKVSGWVYKDGQIYKKFTFKNYYQTIAFVNAIAWLSHREDHHPFLKVGYRDCTIEYSTHSISGISENDFICAAKVNVLIEN